MPAIFNEQNKRIYEERLLEAGLDLMRQKGLKGLRIDTITRKAGFAKSTFYTFFSSKEEFISKIAIFERKKTKELLQKSVNEKGKLDRFAAKRFFQVQFLSDQNIYSCISPEEYEYLKARCPELFQINPDSDEKNTKWLLEKMDTKKKCSWKLFSNYVKGIVTVTIHRDNLYKDIYKETIVLMIDGLVNYIFE
jgi:hypothetical protein